MIRFEAIFRFVFESKQKHRFQLNVSMLLSQCKRSVCFFWRMEKGTKSRPMNLPSSTRSHTRIVLLNWWHSPLYSARLHFAKARRWIGKNLVAVLRMLLRLSIYVCIYMNGPQSRASVDNLLFSTLHSLVYSYKTGMVFIFSFQRNGMTHIYDMCYVCNDTNNKDHRVNVPMFLLCHHSHYILSLILNSIELNFSSYFHSFFLARTNLFHNLTKSYDDVSVSLLLFFLLYVLCMFSSLLLLLLLLRLFERVQTKEFS